MFPPPFGRRAAPAVYRSAAACILFAALSCAVVRADEPDAARSNAKPDAHPTSATAPQNATSKPKTDVAKTPIAKTYLGADVLATVEGEPITRRDFTAFWLKVDTQASRPMGAILLGKIQTQNALAPAYTVRDADIYKALYSGPSGAWATFLSNLITNRLVAREAARRHVVVTQSEAEAAGRALLKQAREQQGLTLSDADILDKFHVPRSLFFQEMTFKLQSERLYADSLARRNGHPLNAEDWIVLRSLFAGANIGTNAPKNAQEFSDAKTRVEKWAGEVKAGKAFSEVADAHNEDETRGQGGLRGPALRGTGTPDVENAVFQLQPGQMSKPLRTKDGWYIFLAEQRGAQIPQAERARAWQQIVDKRQTPFLAELRKHAKITCIIPLPDDTPAASPTAAANK